MPTKLEKVVPFGRTFAVYLKMFNLLDIDLQKKILGVGDGPASFNAEARKKGFIITSVDPIYQFTGAQIKERFEAVVEDIIEQVKSSPEDWVWTYYKSLEDLRKNRLQAMEIFLQDYELGQQEARYQLGELPKLSYSNKQYDLALCSHFLFLYSDHYSLEFHISSVLEMLRVAKEVRIFPLLTLSLKPSPYLNPVIEEVKALGYQVSIEKVDYEFQKGGNQMLKINFSRG